MATALAQLGVLAMAVLVLLGLTLATRGVLAYAAAGTWALVGILATGVGDGTTAVTVLAVVGIVVLVAATLAVQRRDRRPAQVPAG